MDVAIEDMVKECQKCQESRPSPPVAPLHPWEWPSRPWSRLHLDFAGPYLGSMYLILVDAYSKWLDVIPMSSITTSRTIEKLRIVFATHGLPHKIVTDNGPSFTSSEFKDFMTNNGIIHIKSAPYHPSTNGLAERAVKTFKQAVARISGESIQERISKFLFNYRVTPHSVTGVSPSELLNGRRLRCRLDTWYPDLSERVEKQQLQQKSNHDSSKPERSFSVGALVYAKNFSSNTPKWLPGAVVRITGPLSYQVELDSGQVVRRHIDAVRSRRQAPEAEPEQSDMEDPIYSPDIPPAVPLPVQPPLIPAPPPPPPPPQAPPRRSSRPHKPVMNRYGL